MLAIVSGNTEEEVINRLIASISVQLDGMNFSRVIHGNIDIMQSYNSADRS